MANWYQYATKSRTKAPTVELDDGTEVTLPTRWVICPTCQGNGGHSHHVGCLTHDDFDNWDREEIDNYFSGAYDRECSVCEGTGKIVEVDEARCDPLALWAYHLDLRLEREDEALYAAERCMGA
jgi:hypothetical protein